MTPFFDPPQNGPISRKRVARRLKRFPNLPFFWTSYTKGLFNKKKIFARLLLLARKIKKNRIFLEIFFVDFLSILNVTPKNPPPYLPLYPPIKTHLWTPYNLHMVSRLAPAYWLSYRLLKLGFFFWKNRPFKKKKIFNFFCWPRHESCNLISIYVGDLWPPL